MKSLPDYFPHIAKEFPKTYINEYPKSIINIEALKKGILVEIGAGAGNDLLWLLQNGISPENIFSFETDENAYKLQFELFHPTLKIYRAFQFPLDLRQAHFPDQSFNFAYANNVLHCLNDEEDVSSIMSEIYRLLKPRGIFFGRTLSNMIDFKKIKKNYSTKK